MPAEGPDTVLPIEPADVLGAALSSLLVFLCVVFAWRGTASTRLERRQDLLLLPWALVVAVAWHPGFLRGLGVSRRDDPFVTLSGADGIGLAVIALVASLALFALSVAKTRALRRVFARRASLVAATADLLATVLLALAALALAPQLFYAYYRLVFPDLPSKWVLSGLPSAEQLRALLRPLPGDPLADQAAALTLWTLALACVLGWMLDVRRRRRPLGAWQAATFLGALAAFWALLSAALF